MDLLQQHKRRSLETLFALMVVLSGVLCAAAHGQIMTDPMSGIAVRGEPVYKTAPFSGFEPLHIGIRNNSGKDRVWRLVSTSEMRTHLAAFQKFSDELKVPDGEERDFQILIPVAPLFRDSGSTWYNQRLQAVLTGYGIREAQWSVSGSGYSMNDTGFVLMSDTMSLRSWPVLQAELQKRGGPGGSPLQGSSLAVASFPGEWRALLGVSLVVMTDGDWDLLPAAAREAIADWLMLGGHLALFFEGSLNSVRRDFGVFRIPAQAAGPGVVGRLGFGKIHFYGWNGIEIESRFAEVIKRVPVKDQLPGKAAERYQSGWKLADKVPQVKFSSGFMALMTFIVVAYAVIAGPINVFVFAGRRQRLLLFVTTPLIAIAASVLFFSLVALRDGFGGYGHRLTGVYLNSAQRKAIVFQEQISRTGLLWNAGFSAPADAVVMPLKTQQTGESRFESTPGFYSGDYFRNRAVQAQLLVRIVPTRARIEAALNRAEPARSLQVVSSLNVPLEKLVVFGDGDRCWLGSGIEIGKPAKLQAAGKTWCMNSLGLVSGDAGPVIKDTLYDVSSRSGTFAAIAAGSGGFTIDSLTGINWMSDRTAVFGELETSAGGL